MSLEDLRRKTTVENLPHCHAPIHFKKDMAANSSFRPINFEAAGITPEQILAIKPTEQDNRRVEELIAKKKIEGLTAEEDAELETVRQNHVMTMAKIRAMEIIKARTAG